ncbi:RecQ family ATP-dependent DNA helicase (plasmid) [Deinococcus radiomollis]|uniref:RecQ family ATP-dependent DNA helicase n=1 Tax=Deinococcus radiomollis TaxID=468916 RepID=UPI0038923F5C
MSPLLRRLMDHLRTHGPQPEDDLLEAFQIKRSILTRLLKDAHGQLRQQGEYLYLKGQEDRIDALNAAPRSHVRSYVVIDTETTSLDRTEARLLEVAALKIVDGRVAASMQLLVAGEQIPRAVADLTGIRQAELDQDGRPLGDVLLQLLEFVGDLPVVGHNASGFDVPILRRVCREQGLTFRPAFVLDTLLLAPLAFAGESPPVEAYGLSGLHARFCEDVHDDAHRALADCTATSRVLDRMITRLQALPEDLRNLLAALPVPEFALAFPPVLLDAADLNRLTARVAGALTQVSAVWAEGRRASAVRDLLPSPRPGQEQMAQAVADVLTGQGKLVVEAPTGTGKTRAYLYPALLQGQPGKPVVISTHTRQLQDQIVQEARDVAQAGFEVRVVAIKGQSNYICPERFQLLLHRRHRPEDPQVPQGPGRLSMSPGEARAVALLALHVVSGEYSAVPPSPVTRSADFLRISIVTSTVARRCRDACPFSGTCAYHRTQRLVPKANVVVVNHALLLRNQLEGLESENPPFDRVVVDEAHDLQDAAMSALRREISSDAVLSVAREFLRRTQTGPTGLLTAIEAAAGKTSDAHLAQHAQEAAKGFDMLVSRIDTWQATLQAFAMQYGQGSENFSFQAAVEPLVMQGSEWRAVTRAGEELLRSLKFCAGFIPSLAERSEYKMDLEALLVRLNTQIDTLNALMTRTLDGAHVYAVTAGGDSASLWAVPLWVSSMLESLWTRTRSLVFTSATLRVPGTWAAPGTGETADFGVFQKELAIPNAEYLVLPPVLPYALGHVVLTNHLPLVHHPSFAGLVGEELDNLLPQTRHQSLHIFTANERLKHASRAMKGKHLSSVRDGVARTIQGLRGEENWHALGSAGFLQGVDIRDLGLVSLDKTPFPIPDLVLDAQRRDVNDFDTYWNTLYLPRAVLKFVQGFGRLIRDDRAGMLPGAFVVWDKRLAFAQYQDRFLGALPIPAENVHRSRNQADFYAHLSRLWGHPLEFKDLVAPKIRVLGRYREQLRGLREPERQRLLEEALVELFEFTQGQFREGQYRGIAAALDGVDVFSVMPTGAGKSLVFQLPAFLGDSYTVVVSPLVALIQDQVSRLQQLGLPAAGLWGGLSRAEQDSTLEDVRAGRVKLLYLAPERVRKSAAVRKLLQELRPDRVVYDEAHTLLQWGHDFRPDYLHVKSDLDALGVRTAVSAFTATARTTTRRDLIGLLGMDGPERTELSVKRENLYYEVVDVKQRVARHGNTGRERIPSRDEVLLNMLAGLKANEDTRDGRAIVYVGSRQKAERLAAMIGETGVEVAAYHAGLSPAVRSELLDQFQARLIRVMIATNAFGMGVDAPDIYLVVHYDAPLSLESYVQEAGRAGRDPKVQARAVLLWSSGSDRRAKYLIEHSYPDAQQAQDLLHALKAGKAFPTLSELAQHDGVDAMTLPTLLHLLEVSGAVRYSYVPGLCRVYPYYGVALPDNPVLQDLARLSQTEPVHLSRRYGSQASEIEDQLMGWQREGKLGVMLLEPALKVEVLRERVSQTGYVDQVKLLKEKKYALYDELKRYLTERRTCRGHQLQLYFEGQGGPCGNCDVCNPACPAPWDGVSVDMDDLWNPRKELLRLLAHFEKLQYTAGKGTLIGVLRNEEFKSFKAGEQENKSKTFNSTEKSAPNFGKLRFVDAQKIRKALDDLCAQGYAAVEARTFRTGGQALPVVVLTDRGRQEVKRWMRA